MNTLCSLRAAAALSLGLAAVLWLPALADAIFWASSPSPEAAVRRIMDRNGLPGAVLAVGRFEEDPVVRATGADLSGKPLDRDSRLRIDSLSKPITAAAIHRLVVLGRLGLDHRLVSVVPLARRAADPMFKTITIRHLLQHAGGWAHRFAFDGAGDSCLPIARKSLPLPLDYPPGSRHVYSNLGYCWLELVVTAIAGSYEQFVADEILHHDPDFTLVDRVRGGAWGWAATADGYFRFLGNLRDWPQGRVMIEGFPLPYDLGLFRMAGGYGHLGWQADDPKSFSFAIRKADGTAIVALFAGHPARVRETAFRALAALSSAGRPAATGYSDPPYSRPSRR